MLLEKNKLDSPVWFSLTETHKDFSIDYNVIKFYHPDYCPFGGFLNIDKTANSLNEYSKIIHTFYVVGQRPKFNRSMILKKEIVCNKTILEKKNNIEIDDLYNWTKENKRPFTMGEFPLLINKSCGIDLSPIYNKWKLPIE